MLPEPLEEDQVECRQDTPGPLPLDRDGQVECRQDIPGPLQEDQVECRQDTPGPLPLDRDGQVECRQDIPEALDRQVDKPVIRPVRVVRVFLVGTPKQAIRVGLQAREHEGQADQDRITDQPMYVRPMEPCAPS